MKHLFHLLVCAAVGHNWYLRLTLLPSGVYREHACARCDASNRRLVG